MNNSLAEQYFSRALDSAKKAELSAAIRFVSIALGLAPAEEKAWRLAGLCYYQLGNYKMAGYCFGQFTAVSPPHVRSAESDEQEDWQAAILKRQEQMSPAITMANQGNYKKAAAYLVAAADKTVGEWNYLGCLYALLGRKEKAADCFAAVFKMDRGNANALDCLSGLGQMKKRRWWPI